MNHFHWIAFGILFLCSKSEEGNNVKNKYWEFEIFKCPSMKTLTELLR